MKKTLTAHRKPTAPATLTVTRLSATSAALAWIDTCTFETGVQIQRRETGGTWFTIVALQVANATSYVDADMAPGLGYDYRVRAMTLTTSSPYSAIVSVTGTVPVPTPLDAPVGVSATAGDAAVTVAYSPVTGATGYKLKRSTTNGGPYGLVTATSAVTVADTGLTNGTRCYYVVAATGPTGDSVNSAQVFATPTAASTSPATLAAPTGVTATPGDTTATIGWAGVTGATSYTLLRGTNAFAFTAVASGLTATSYQNTGLTDGTTYYFIVRAVNASTTSADSAVVSVTPAATVTVPSAPTGVSCTAGNATNTLFWTASAGATSYVVQRSTTSGSGYAIVATGVTAVTFVNTGLTNGTAYYYVVKAVNSVGPSVASSQVTGTPVADRTGATISAGLSGVDFQAALNLAQGGDTITLAAGVTYTGNFTLPVKTGSQVITITTTGTVPAVTDLRVATNRTAFLAAAANFPKLVTPNGSGVLNAEYGAHHYLIQGVELAAVDQGVAGQYGLLLLGWNGLDTGHQATTLAQLPTDITVDRCYLHGTSTGHHIYGIQANGINVVVENSYFDEFHSGFSDSQAITWYNTPGPIRIENNYLRAAGENILSGGAGAKVILNAVPSSVQILNNYCTKKLAWKSTDPSWDGSTWVVKNILEIKNGADWTIRGNYFEHCWSAGQDGSAIVFTPRNQPASTNVTPAAVGASTVTFVSGATSEEAYYTDATLVVTAGTGIGQSRQVTGYVGSTRVATVDSAWSPALDSTSRLQISWPRWAKVQTILFERNIIKDAAIMFNLQGWDDGAPSAACQGLTIQHNLCYGDAGARFISCNRSPANLTIVHNTCDFPATGSGVVNVNTDASTGTFGIPIAVGHPETITGFILKDNMLRHGLYGMTGQSTTGNNALTLSTYYLSPVITTNVFGGGASGLPATNLLPTNAAFDASFVSPSTGNYRLVTGSPYKSAASDGTDIGVNMDLLPVVS